VGENIKIILIKCYKIKDEIIKKTRSKNLVLITIPTAGVEPARCCRRWIL